MLRRRALALWSAALLVAAPLALAGPTATSRTAPAAAPTGGASVVLDWQRTALRTVYTEGLSPIPAWRGTRWASPGPRASSP